MITEATQNTPLIAMYDQLNALRRTIVWGRLRRRHDHPPRDHHSFGEHDRIVDAIEDRDLKAAENAMRGHLVNVARGLLELHEAAE